MTEPGEPDRPGPYRGPGGYGFGQGPASAGPPPGARPGSAGSASGNPVPTTSPPGALGSGGRAGFRHPGMPRPGEVTAVSSIGFALGGLICLLLAFLPTDAGSEIAETLTGFPDRRGVVAVAALLTAAAYVVPAYYLLRRRGWARVTMIVVASVGVAGGALSLPGGLLGLVVHLAALVLLLRPVTRAWFATRPGP